MSIARLTNTSLKTFNIQFYIFKKNKQKLSKK